MKEASSPKHGRPDPAPTPPPATSRLYGARRVLRPLALPADRALIGLNRLRLRWIYLREGIEGIQAELRRMRADHAVILRDFGAEVADDASIPGPLSIVNSRRDFANLRIGPRTHIGSEVFFDLAAPITVEAGATVSMRVMLITHLDVGRGPLSAARPRREAPVVVREGAFIGAAAVVLHGVTIGREAVVGAGVVVDRDVADGEVLRRPRSARNA